MKADGMDHEGNGNEGNDNEGMDQGQQFEFVDDSVQGFFEHQSKQQRKQRDSRI